MKLRFLALACVLSLVSLAEIPLPEHPRPDWSRAGWMNLNGTWKFASDKQDAGCREKWFEADDAKFAQSILVPFPWGSALSGVKDEADIGWYRRDITVPAEWKGKRVFLVVGASDHDTTVWFGKHRLGEHSGGYTPFEFEITDHIAWGVAQKLTIRAWDAGNEMSRSDWRLYGKQGYGNARGIWQTVYLEARGDEYLETVHFTPDIENGSVTADVTLGAPAKKPLLFSIAFKPEDRAKVATASFLPGQMSAKVKIALRDVKLWDLEHPYLYEVVCSLKDVDKDGKPLEEAPARDEVNTYFGMRKVGMGKIPGTEFPCVTLNGKPIYLQLTLDQSYHPEGFYTFPTDEFMKNEILISKKLALSGNRVHIKVEVPRKLYWADKLGLLIMADVPCAWGAASEAMFREHWFCFEGMVKRDFNHPSVFSWVLFNETWGLFADGENWGRNRAQRYAPWVRRAVAQAYAKAKRLDPTRLVEDNSPCNHDHVVTDLNTWHAYTAGYNWENTVSDWCKGTFPGSTRNYIGGFVQGNAPMLNSECGNVWGYDGSTGDCDWSWDYHLMINAFRRHLQCTGWLYTEHHDVINEWNGYVRFDRTPKYTGIEDLFPGSKLQDWHADAFLPLDTELCREFKAGETWMMPVDVSLTTDKYAGHKLAVTYRVRAYNAKGKFIDGLPVDAGTFTGASWQNGRVLDVPVKLPNETACGVICFSLVDGDAVVGRNFACFVTRANPSADTISVPAGSFTKATWSQKQWNILDGLKACGAGKGAFEYVFKLPEGAQNKTLTFRAEVSSKRLNAKDSTDLDKGTRDLDCMLGGGFADRSKNPNSYPMTCDFKWPGEVQVFANGVLVKTVALPDDPADHRGILSWFAQPRDRKLREAGSYGWLVEAEISAEVAAKGAGTVTIRLAAEKGGLAVYGEKFGRYPFDPSISF